VSQAAESKLWDSWPAPPRSQVWSELQSEALEELEPPIVAPDPSRPYIRRVTLHAPPLLPLRERDFVAIDALFQAANMAEIQADILENLRHYRPELHWDDLGLAVLKQTL
jgi:hypothetical protein